MVFTAAIATQLTITERHRVEIFYAEFFPNIKKKKYENYR